MTTPYGNAPVGPAGSEPPSSNLVWGILTTLFCCLPLGIVSIVFAAQVNGKWAAGDQAGARDSASKAKKFAVWAAVLGVVLYVILGVVYGVTLSALLAEDPDL